MSHRQNVWLKAKANQYTVISRTWGSLLTPLSWWRELCPQPEPLLSTKYASSYKSRTTLRSGNTETPLRDVFIVSDWFHVIRAQLRFPNYQCDILRLSQIRASWSPSGPCAWSQSSALHHVSLGLDFSRADWKMRQGLLLKHLCNQPQSKPGFVPGHGENY